MGDFSREEVQTKYRHGQQALMVEAEDAVRHAYCRSYRRGSAWTREDFVDEVLDKARQSHEPPTTGSRFDCATWLADEDGVARLEGG